MIQKKPIQLQCKTKKQKKEKKPVAIFPYFELTKDRIVRITVQRLHKTVGNKFRDNPEG